MTQAPPEPPPEPPDAARPDAPADDGEDLLIDGQEEVFSRAEVERGLIEHHSLEEDLKPTPVDPDEPMAENFRASFNPRP